MIAKIFNQRIKIPAHKNLSLEPSIYIEVNPSSRARFTSSLLTRVLLVFGASPFSFLFLATVRLGGEVDGGDGGCGGGRGEGSVQRLHQGYQLVTCTNLMVKSLLRPNSKGSNIKGSCNTTTRETNS